VSVITFPRRVDTRPARPSSPPRTRQATHRAKAPRRAVVGSRWRGASTLKKSSVVLAMSLTLAMAGSMVVANRQVEIHQLQSQLLQAQSSYADQVGALTNLAAPGQIATQAGALHLVDPVSVTQVPSTSLDAPLPPPKFLGSAPVTSRTIR
jgi:hypothetical protein